MVRLVYLFIFFGVNSIQHSKCVFIYDNKVGEISLYRTYLVSKSNLFEVCKFP